MRYMTVCACPHACAVGRAPHIAGNARARAHRRDGHAGRVCAPGRRRPPGRQPDQQLWERRRRRRQPGPLLALSILHVHHPAISVYDAGLESIVPALALLVRMAAEQDDSLCLQCSRIVLLWMPQSGCTRDSAAACMAALAYLSWQGAQGVLCARSTRTALLTTRALGRRQRWPSPACAASSEASEAVPAPRSALLSYCADERKHMLRIQPALRCQRMDPCQERIWMMSVHKLVPSRSCLVIIDHSCGRRLAASP